MKQIKNNFPFWSMATSFLYFLYLQECTEYQMLKINFLSKGRRQKKTTNFKTLS